MLFLGSLRGIAFEKVGGNVRDLRGGGLIDSTSGGANQASGDDVGSVCGMLGGTGGSAKRECGSP
jgi:hypothetical protein